MPAGKIFLAAKAGARAAKRGSSRPKSALARVKKLARVVKMIMPETKHYAEGNVVAVAQTTTATVQPLLDNIAVGTGEADRTGNEITITSVSIPIELKWDSSNTFTAGTPQVEDQVVRVMLIQDKQNSGAAPAIADILDTANTANPYMALQNVFNTKRFKQLYDRKFVMGPYICTHVNKTLHKRFKNYKVEYDADNGNATKNALFLVFISNTNVANENPLVTADLRVNYLDN